MWKSSITCVGSAFLGAVAALVLTQQISVGPGAVAQSGVPARQAAPLQIPLNQRNDAAASVLTAEEEVGAQVYEKNNRAVVNITTNSSRRDNFFLLDVPQEGSGSGILLDLAGHILTNFHVVENASRIRVTMFNGEVFDAEAVGVDAINDTAVIRIDAPRELLHPVEFGNSAGLKVGMTVFAIGNPFGLERTMTRGIISSLSRSLPISANRSIKSIIQTDAAINPGNSGGPLFDSRGRLIGMNTAIATRSGQNAGVGFSIPADLLARVVPELIRNGRIVRPEIGIERVLETEKGMLITRLAENGPAAKAGLRGPQIERRRQGPFILEREDRSAADVVIGVDGTAVHSVDELLTQIEQNRPGDRVTIEVIRSGKIVKVPVVLGGERE